MNYLWTECSGCGCQIAIQFVERPEGVAGSVRRWSSNRSVNDGKKLEVPSASVAADGSFSAVCVCGAEIPVRPEAVEHASTES
ncbi:MAG: hypothetical protein WAU32_08260 [Thermoanaerobaculia bacterium]|jgi:hypothetical protein